MPSILLIGPGAIGATLAAWLAQDDRNHVSVAVRTPIDSLEVTTPQGIIRAKPQVLTDPAQAQHVDWILVATKTYDSEAAAEWFAGATGKPQRFIVVALGHVQRGSFGLVHDAIASWEIAMFSTLGKGEVA